VTSVAGPRGEELAAGLRALEFSGVATVAGPHGLIAEVAMGLADRANGVEIEPETRFGIASVGKLFTATALVSLFEQGAASLADRVVDLLPAARRPSALDERMTLEHLLTHTSGMADYVDEVAGERYEDLWLTWNPAIVRRPIDLLPMFADRPPLAAPGEQVRYNNAAFVLLGLALEALTSRPYEQVVEMEVFEPSGMTATGFPALDDVAPGLAIGYQPPDDAVDAWRTNVYAIPARGQPDGGAYSTTGDLLRFLDAWLAGRLTGTHWRDEMMRPRVRDEEAHWGLSVLHLGEGARARFGHGGTDPGASARLAFYPESGLRIAVLSNVTEGTGASFRAIEAALIPDGRGAT
jgi:CubicO group peptidase (beta-lactamase class C family)